MAEQIEVTGDDAANDRAKIMAPLEAMSVESRERLRSAVDAVEALGDEETGEWVSKEGVMPSLAESCEVQELRMAIYDAGLVVPFDWPTWVRGLDPTLELPVDEPISAVGTITVIVRGDRFSEGTLRSNIESGSLLKAIRVALAG